VPAIMAHGPDPSGFSTLGFLWELNPGAHVFGPRASPLGASVPHLNA
jgi:hypothetical protein